MSALADAAEHALAALREYIADTGGCDHPVGICQCPDIRAADSLAEAIKVEREREMGASGQLPRAITLHYAPRGGWAIHEGERYIDRLCWDEMMGSLAHLTIGNPNPRPYMMATAEEWQLRAQAARERRDARCAGEAGWIACADRLPEVKVGPWEWADSPWLLVRDSAGDRFMACLRVDGDPDPEFKAPPRWIMRGRDGFELEDITHWREMPE